MADDNIYSLRHRAADKAAPTSWWLWAPTKASRTSHKSFLSAAKHDRILSLSRAIKDQGDATQELMLIKSYLFIRDCIPHGLTGAYAHILGDDVMEYLLS